jgi:hypothetical protein
MATLDEVKQILAKTVHAGPMGEEAILAAESQLGVRLPPSYRWFLSTYGAAFGNGIDIDGLFLRGDLDECPLWTDIVGFTLRLREVSRGRMPQSLIPISGDGGDYKYYLDTSRARDDGECPIVVLGPGADGVVISEDFLEFVVRLSNDTLSF